jgi:hypothetical protein
MAVTGNTLHGNEVPWTENFQRVIGVAWSVKVAVPGALRGR